MPLRQIVQGDALAVLRTWPAESVHAVVTDPPYGLHFMGKAWDHGLPDAEVWREVHRVLKPGGHVLAFGGTRTHHRMWCDIEDAGLEVRDTICWLFGQGFPKSHNLRGDWEGWGTALKPAWEPIIVARKPCAGTVAANVETHGCGALNVRECAVEINEKLPTYRAHGSGKVGSGGVYEGGYAGNPTVLERPHPDSVRHRAEGRWPANVAHDGSAEVLERFAAFGEKGASAPVRGTEPSKPGNGITQGHRARVASEHHGDTGSAARFFYCAKASRGEREAGLRALPENTHGMSGGAQSHGEGDDAAQGIGLNRVYRARNNHPTVKPIALMRWLVRLVTPPGGVVLDPFAGSGTTLCAAALEGASWIGIEQHEPYVAIARARAAYWQRVAEAGGDEKTHRKVMTYEAPLLDAAGGA